MARGVVYHQTRSSSQAKATKTTPTGVVQGTGLYSFSCPSWPTTKSTVLGYQSVYQAQCTMWKQMGWVLEMSQGTDEVMEEGTADLHHPRRPLPPVSEG